MYGMVERVNKDTACGRIKVRFWGVLGGPGDSGGRKSRFSL